MKWRFDLGATARTAFFALLPWVCAVAVLAVAAFFSVAGFLSLRPSLLRQAIEKRPLWLALLLAFIAWAVLSSLWSTYADHIQALKLVLTLAGGLLFAAAASRDRAARRLTLAGGLAAFAASAVLLGAEAWSTRLLNHTIHPTLDTGMLDRTTGRGATILVLMVWPLAASLLTWFRPSMLRTVSVAAILIVGGAISLQFEQLSNTLAFGAGALAFGIAFLAPRIAVWGATALASGWVLIAPFAIPILFANQRLFDALPLSGAARVVIWRYVAQRVPENLWFGHGLDASRMPSPPMLPVRDGYSVAAIPLHPHSASMQIWFELGAVGAVIAAMAIVGGGWSIARRLGSKRASAAAAAATIVGAAVIGNIGFGLWQEWWDASMLLAATLVACVNAKPDAVLS